MWGRRRGFTYLEIAIVMALLAIFLALGVGLARPSHGRPQSRSAAETLCAFLRVNRELARSSGQAVGVIWPGTLSQGCQALQGWDQPHRVDKLDVAHDFPQTEVFVGHWNSLGSPFSDQRPQWGSRDDDCDPAQWLPGRASDPALIFLPSGKVTARGCWRLGDNYVVVVGKRLQTSGGLLTAAENCFTVRISPTGWVDWSNGLRDGALAAPGPAASAAATLPPTVQSQLGPRLKALRITPDPARLRLPAGVDALVSADGFLSLTVEADCPSGQSLFCQWTDPSAEPGAFSAKDRQPMQWDPVNLVWRCETHWRPPDSASNGAQYHLTCHVTDESQREAPQPLTGQVDLEVRDQKARMAFIDVTASPTGKHRMQVVNEDGTGKRELHTELVTGPSEAPKASWSPDGTRLAYLSKEAGVTRVWTCNADGSASLCVDRGLPGEALSLQGVHWSPDGTWLAQIRRLPSGLEQIYLVHPDGSGGQNLNAGSDSDSFVVYFTGSSTNNNVVSRDNSVFSENGKYVASIVSGQKIRCYATPGSGAATVTLPIPGQFSWSVVWNPVYPFIAFSSSTGLKIYDVGASTYFNVPPDIYAAGPGCFSPDGRTYIYGKGPDLFQANLLPGHVATTTPLMLTGQMLGWIDDDRFTYWKPAPSDLWVRERPGGQEQNLTNEGADSMFCGWTR